MSRPIPGDPLSPIPLVHAPQQPAPAPLANMYAPNPFAIASPSAPGTGGQRALPNIAELFHSFKRRWVLATLIGGIVASVVAAAVWMVMPSGKHQVRAIIQMRATVSNGLFKEPGQDNDAFERYKEGQLANMKKRDFLAHVGNDPSVRSLPMLEGTDDKAGVYESLLSFKWDSPEMLHVKMNGDDKEQLRALLSAFVKVYAAEAKSEERAGLKRQQELLIKSKDEANRKIEAINAKLQLDQKKNGGGGDSGIQKQMIVTEIHRLTGEIGRLESEEVRLASELQQIEGELKGEVQIDPDTLTKKVNRDGRVVAKLAIVDRLNSDLAGLKKFLQPGSPRLLETQSDLDKATNALEAERKLVRPELVKEVQVERQSELLSLQARLTQSITPVRTQLKAQRAAQESQQLRLKNLGDGIMNNAIATTELAPTIAMRDKFATQLDEITSILGSEETRVSIKEDAVIAENYNLKQKMVMATGGAAAAMLGILLVISYLEWRNRRVDGVDQVVAELGMRVIGTIPAFPSRASLRSGEASQNQNWRFILNESVNSTRTMLLHTAKTQQMQIILVTSAMQGEGKTSLSSQLATSMATAGLRTLILDCDLRNPSMQKLFDIPVAPGCSEILLQEIDIADAVQPTSVPNLWIIPAGQCNHRVIAALAQGHPLEAMFNRLRGQFDIIVVDSCPILPVADTLLVAQHVDGVVFSILQDVSQLPKVQDASDRMVQLNIPLLGAVVNGIKPDIQAYGYNYVKQLPA
jgi:succinoglycan biosynthesis transport protein ExoP